MQWNFLGVKIDYSPLPLLAQIDFHTREVVKLKGINFPSGVFFCSLSFEKWVKGGI